MPWYIYDPGKPHPKEYLMESEGRCIHCNCRESDLHKEPYAEPTGEA